MSESPSPSAARLVVGVSGSLGSLTALSLAADVARYRGAELWPVLASSSLRGISSRPCIITSVRGRPWCSTNATTQSVPRSIPAVGLGEHGVGLADAGCSAEMDPKLAACRVIPRSGSPCRAR